MGMLRPVHCVASSQAEEEVPDPTGEPETLATETPAPEQHEGEPPTAGEADRDDQAIGREPEGEDTEGPKPGEQKEEDSSPPLAEEGAEPVEETKEEISSTSAPAEGTEAVEETKEKEEEIPSNPAPEETEGGTEEGAGSPAIQAPTAQPEKKGKKEKDRKAKDKKDKPKDKEKKQKKKSKASGLEGGASKMKKQSSNVPSRRSGHSSNKQVEVIMLSMFRPYDPDSSGYLDPSVFWQVSIGQVQHPHPPPPPLP